jgi:hypothetical protein
MDGAVRHIDSGRPGTGALTWPPLLGAGTHMTSDPSHELTPPTRPEDVWDKFIDALDRAGQAGGAQGVCVPAVATGTLAGRAFGTLTRDDVRQLARVAQAAQATAKAQAATDPTIVRDGRATLPTRMS